MRRLIGMQDIKSVYFGFVAATCLLVASPVEGGQPESTSARLRVAPFIADITPPMGEPICGGLCKPTESIEHPLLAKGVVLQDGGGTYVLCVMDLAGLCMEPYDLARQRIAAAAGTAASHVAVHAVHQHTANTLDLDSQRLIENVEGVRTITTRRYFDQVISATAGAVRDAMGKLRQTTHVGTSRVKVDRVASSRRLVQPDGSIRTRGSSAPKSELRELPEGLIDPWLRTISFYDGDDPLVYLHYYATHPQSFYGDGRVTYDVPGIARERLESQTGVVQVYFNGCGGNIGMGKYNVGSREARGPLADRLFQAMAQSVNQTERHPVGPVHWRTTRVEFPLRMDDAFSAEACRRMLENKDASNGARIKAANILAWIDRGPQGRTIELTCLAMDPIRILHLPGETFVEYQLWAQGICQNKFVAVAGYGDCAMWYVCTDQAYRDRGGYEQTWAFSAPCERRLKDAITTLVGRDVVGREP